MLSKEGTDILKFFLRIDLDEQKESLQARLDDPKKQWKFRKRDQEDRKLWPESIQSYQHVHSKTCNPYAPCFIITSKREWYRNLSISSILIEALKNLKMQYPAPGEDLEGLIIE
jgi:polyphosphate kinase 2 (PPK2 family)